jgi:argininosuccinate lyase
VLDENVLNSAKLTGRIRSGPADLLRTEILDNQFRYELQWLLPSYVAIDKVLILEYYRMGTLNALQASALARVLDAVDPSSLEHLRAQSMSDICFALELYVAQNLSVAVPRWHVDRSRNDTQACAQLMFGREEIGAVVEQLLEFGLAARELAERTVDIIMPGYTHFQSAQIITVGFYFATLSEQVIRAVSRLAATYEGSELCPLGSGAMAGQQLPWDRQRMARLLGFKAPAPLALSAVASRSWLAESLAELSLVGVVLSRFCTDLLMWSSGSFGFFGLPDEFCGVSSAMPQKKNYPVLERIRGQSGHLAAFYLDVVLGQRNTPFSNLVEVSKEAGAHSHLAFDTAQGMLRLFTAVLRNLTINKGTITDACRRDFFGGFTLANILTLAENVPWRLSQVVSGSYIAQSIDNGAKPQDIDAELLRATAAAYGLQLQEPTKALRKAFAVEAAAEILKSDGSANPTSVRSVLEAQAADYASLREQWRERRQAQQVRREKLDRELDCVMAADSQSRKRL